MNKKKFVNLHCHDTFSIFDGIGYPEDFMRFAHESGMDAIATTNHGNMNSLVYQIAAHKKLKNEGKIVKPIFGVESYYIPSLKEWKHSYDQWKEETKKKRESKDEKSALIGSGTTAEDEHRFDKNIINRRSHLLLLAKNQTGLNNLFSLVSKGYKLGFYRFPRIDTDLLRQHSEGIIASSACLGGVLAHQMHKNREYGHDKILQAMREVNETFIDIFGDNWFLELQWNELKEQHELNKYLLQLHYETGVKLISTTDAHYPNPKLWKDQILYKKLGWLSAGSKDEFLALPNSIDELDYQLYPKTGDEVWGLYQKYKERYPEIYEGMDDTIEASIANTYSIAFDLIEDFLPDTTIKLPSFIVPEGKTADETLTELALEALSRKGLATDPVYKIRLQTELDTIISRKFSKYFLTEKAIVDIAKTTMMIGPGRGSAAGSLLAYVLGITEVDPIKFNLQFERFILKDSDTFPDIDTDVSEPMRLKEMLIEKWGEDSVVPISNFNTLQLRSLIKDISKFYNIPFTEVNPVTSKMIAEATGPAKAANGIKAGAYVPTYEEVLKYSTSLQKFFSAYPAVGEHVTNLLGMIRSVSRHAGGAVVSENLLSSMPLISSGGVIQSPWCEGLHVKHLEPMGFIKYDLLGLSTLAMIEKTIKNILVRRENREITFEDITNFYNEKLNCSKINFDDKRVWRSIFRSPKRMSAGIFQFSGEGAQKFCAKAKPSGIEELAALTAIYRPGPLSSNVDKTYINAKEYPDSVQYEHPLMKKILEKNYGHIVFQEDIANIVHMLGKDITLDEGNKFRKLLIKAGTDGAKDDKILQDKLQKIYNKFFDGCKEKGIKEKVIENIWKKMEYFCGYGFARNHAIPYAIISYQCAWLSTYYPNDWMVAYLDKEPEDKKAKAIGVARSAGYNIVTIDINKSPPYEWAPSNEDDKTLIQPLASIKGLGEAAIQQILDNRPFNNIEQLLFNDNVSYSKLNKKALDVMLRAGALNELMDSRFSGMKHFWSCVAVDRPKTEKQFQDNIPLYAAEGDFTRNEKIDFISSLTGYYPIDKVMTDQEYAKLDRLCIPPISKWDEALKMVWFIPRVVVVKQTKKSGKDYYIMTVVDNDGAEETIKIWGVDTRKDVIPLNRLCIANIEYDDSWGYSLRNIRKNFRAC